MEDKPWVIFLFVRLGDKRPCAHIGGEGLVWITFLKSIRGKGEWLFLDLGTKILSTDQLKQKILSEVSQTEKDKYHMISLICGI